MSVTAACPSPAAMKIGDLVIYQGGVYVLRGFDPMGVPDRHVQLEDPATGESLSAPLAEVSPHDP
jgi:hypothetical protein